jgi:hypothetical protein
MPIVKGKSRKYPLGGLGLRKKEEEQLEGVLKKYDVSMKYLQRVLVRKLLRGEIDLGLTLNED